MATVYIPSKFKRIVDLCSAKVDSSLGPVFETNMHLMIFAAFVGAEFDEYDDSSWEKGNEIQDKTFYSNNLEGAVFLLALHREQSAEILRSESEHGCWGVFEAYAAGGFKVLDDWLIENPGITDVADIFVNQIKLMASSIVSASDEPEHVPPIQV